MTEEEMDAFLIMVLTIAKDDDLPELTDDEREAMESLPPDFIQQLLEGTL